ncbi:MAG: hypothetical protein GPOALKHO_002004 [Sodalis sp.]|nr:MAG: hypothetical protein GPOALKHO_002004 [Sodalis sp.]
MKCRQSARSKCAYQASQNGPENTPFFSTRQMNQTLIEFECNKIINHLLANQKLNENRVKRLILLIVITLSGSVLPVCHIAPPADRAFSPMQQYYRRARTARPFIKPHFPSRNSTFVMRQHFTIGTHLGCMQSSVGRCR